MSMWSVQLDHFKHISSSLLFVFIYSLSLDTFNLTIRIYINDRVATINATKQLKTPFINFVPETFCFSFILFFPFICPKSVQPF